MGDFKENFLNKTSKLLFNWIIPASALTSIHIHMFMLTLQPVLKQDNSGCYHLLSVYCHSYTEK